MLAFFANMMFVVLARTALLYVLVLTILFAVRHLDRRAMWLLFAAAAVTAILTWFASPYLRERVERVGLEYREYTETFRPTSTGQRLEYWRQSIQSFAEAPLLGHGTGATLAVRLAQHLQTNLAALVLAAPLLGTVPGPHSADPRLDTDPFPARDLSRDPAVGGRFLADPLVWHGELPLRTSVALHEGLQAIGRGPRLRLPVLRLHGDADTIVPLEPSTAALRRLVDPESLTDEIVPGGRHHLLLGTERERTIPAITGFLAACLRPSPTALA
jgi:pimeloyl-ACP methyl ester carboxylesterase